MPPPQPSDPLPKPRHAASGVGTAAAAPGTQRKPPASPTLAAMECFIFLLGARVLVAADAPPARDGPHLVARPPSVPLLEDLRPAVTIDS
ncbi:hypothetical protein PVAP13_3NG168600 [Panicum virgatum]|uniref:Uncharacterized protein n=1 Tax=Panicum virgatum TaxID=38727 RepID=A0A8T0UDY2_PANVG|nr:hypothetical protein PVAP13_3NG168600 [Panicum virgatum]